MTGTGDADLYVNVGFAKVSTSSWTCRPYTWHSNETCGPMNAPGLFSVMVRGYSSTSTVTVKVTQTDTQQAAKTYPQVADAYLNKFGFLPGVTCVKYY
jgi:hypothetical protein